MCFWRTLQVCTAFNLFFLLRKQKQHHMLTQILIFLAFDNFRILLGRYLFKGLQPQFVINISDIFKALIVQSKHIFSGKPYNSINQKNYSRCLKRFNNRKPFLTLIFCWKQCDNLKNQKIECRLLTQHATNFFIIRLVTSTDKRLGSHFSDAPTDFFEQLTSVDTSKSLNVV